MPFVVAHLSIPDGEAERGRWLARYVAVAVSSGVEPTKAQSLRSFITLTLSILSPEDDQAVLREAGFTDVRLFYAGFTWCPKTWDGLVAYCLSGIPLIHNTVLRDAVYLLALFGGLALAESKWPVLSEVRLIPST